MTIAKLATALAAAFVALALAGPVSAGNDTSTFATQYNDCLGGLRSAIARGDLDGVVLPSGLRIPAGFSGAFNPGDHLGTVLERWFLTQIGGVPEGDLAALCATAKEL